ncbi:MAG: GDP-mannose 4,6-dehydratase [Candidatus Iainarchaeum archaeon]|uniref:GDP-mannose 4,6-dehydratase n=1 Tax=Candidatus Iainarchaeum sp. TaxID=3101447 RepID=A0A7T9I2K9_9ARCH|nr:MAG: GDP-mannose 4,6-dehydratase [Candidatus Diapherotrites archaeon]
MKNVLVTGGSGFIGRRIVKKLLERGDIFVTVLDNFSNSSPSNLDEFSTNPHLVQVLKGSVENASDVDAAFKTKFDIVFHLAAQVNVQHSIDHPESDFAANAIGTFNVLERCRQQNGKFVLVSTCMVYDLAGSNKPISEAHPTKPKSPYAASKLAAENLVESYFYAYGMPTVVLRPFNTYGPFQKTNNEGGVVPVFIKQFLDNKPITVFGDGTQTRDLLYVEDTADFIVKAGFDERAVGKIFNAGLGRDISVNDLAFIITKNKDAIKHTTHPHPQAEIKRLWCDATKAHAELDWKPRYTLEQGIQETMDWIKKTK